MTFFFLAIKEASSGYKRPGFSAVTQAISGYVFVHAKNMCVVSLSVVILLQGVNLFSIWTF